jgi:RHS repeat-associated protein
MFIRQFIRKFLLLGSLLTASAGLLHAADESYIQSVSGKIKKGDSCTVIDDKFLNLPLDQWNLVRNISVNNLITFELRQDTNIFYYNKPFTCSLNFSIKYFSNRDQLIPTEINNISLVVKYDSATGKSYKVFDRYTFKNAYKVIIVVNSITSPEWGDQLPAVFRIKNQILVQRKYPFSRDINASLGLSLQSEEVPGDAVASRVNPGTPADNYLAVSWDQNDFTNYPGGFGAPEEYDVEWTYIDALNPDRATPFATNTVTEAQVAEFMRFDNTRVTVTSTTYKIILAYADGYVVIRVRGAWFDDINNIRITTDWQYKNSSNQIAFASITYFEQNLNWQYTISFAEEGKSKAVSSFFDGSLRSRQAVTITNSDNKAIIAETIYDNMGRPAISILPAPTNDNKFKYYPAFNKNMANEPYSHTDISSNCTIGAEGLNTTAGAAQYYSPNNAFINDPEYYFTKYVPDSRGMNGDANKGFPFTLTQYMSDNTGRIKRQGGVGYDFRIGSGRETNYFYGKPLQSELDRLFGVEVGESSHYLKNMVIDPNGQISVSYVDASGKTIATALAGKAPGNVDELSSALDPEFNKTMTQTLMRPSDFQANPGTLVKEATATFLAAVKNETFTVLYNVDPASFGPWNGPGVGQQFCSNCYYDIEIMVKDDCGNPLASATTPAFQANDVLCNPGQASFTGSLNFFVQKYGEHTISYRLRLSEDVIKYQTEYYLSNNIDLKKLQWFFEQELLQTDLLGCFSDCESCKKVGDLASFTLKAKAILDKIKNEKYPTTLYPTFNINSDEINEWIADQWEAIVENCTAITADCIPSPCEQKLTMMKYDVLPGGQYLLYDDNYNIMPGQEGVNIINYKNGVLLNYKSDPDITDFEFTDENGVIHHIKDAGLTVPQFIKAYLQHPEWADDFVKRHIEYCSYLWCKDASNPNQSFSNEVSYKFDEKLREIISKGDDAVSGGFYDQGNYLQLSEVDPFFNVNGRGFQYKAQLQADLTNLSAVLRIRYKDLSGNYLPTKNIQQLVEWMLYCKPTSATATDADFVNSWNCTPNATCRSLTAEWELYRNYYLNIKSKYVRLAKLAYYPSCENCFIGQDPLSAGICEDPGPLSDYSLFGGMITQRVRYKNGTESFKGNYRIKLRYTPNNAIQYIDAIKGTYQTDFIPNIYGDPIFEILEVKCINGNPQQSCDNPAGGGGEPSCYLIGEFSADDRNCQFNSCCNGYQWDECQTYITRPAGPVNQTVVLRIAQAEVTYWPYASNTTYFDVTLSPGQQEVYVGNSIYRISAPPYPDNYMEYRTFWVDQVVSCSNCPTASEFHVLDTVPYFVFIPPCNSVSANERYYVHTNGPVSQNVHFQVAQYVQTNSGTQISYEWKTLNVGQQSVYIGNPRTEFTDLNGNCNQEVEEITIYDYLVVAESIDCTPSGFVCPSIANFTYNLNPNPGIACASDEALLTVTYTGSLPSLPFPRNKKITVTGYATDVLSIQRPFSIIINNVSGSGSACIANFVQISSVTFTGINCEDIPAASSTCAEDPRAPLYATKIRIWNEFVEGESYLNCMADNAPTTQAEIDAQTAASIARMRQDAVNNLDALKQNWIDRLKAVRDEENANDIANNLPPRFSFLTDPWIVTLTDNLYQVALKYIEIAPKSNIRPASTLPVTEVASNGYNNFSQVFNSIIGFQFVEQGFGPHLLDNPYPYDKTPVMANDNTGNIDPGSNNVCQKVTVLKTRWINAGSPNGSFHEYLVAQLKEDYKLTSDELSDLENRCATGCKLLDEPLILPAVFAADIPTNNGYTPWITCSDYNSIHFPAFQAYYPNVSAGTKLYRNLLTNFMNARFGFALSFDDYNDFKNTDCVTDPNAALYAKPQSPSIEIENDIVCAENILRNVFDKAGQEYELYVEVERYKFRNGYISKCLSANASAKLQGKQYEYHYTLYYYDQSGNLVKTIPPEGVNILSDADLELVEDFRDEDQQVCTDGCVPGSENATAVFNAMSDELENNNARSIEMWLNSTGTSTERQVRIITPDNKYFYQLAIKDGKLWAEMYSLQPNSANDIDIILSAQAVADISALHSLQNWTHVVVQSSVSLTGGELQLFYDGVKLTNLTGNMPAYPFQWEIIAGISNYTLPQQDIAALKHFRIYNRIATDAEVLAEYKNTCLSPVGALASYTNSGGPLALWGRFNIPSSQSVTVPNKGALQLLSSAPAQANEGYIPSVSNNFTMELWVSPEETIDLVPEATSGYNGVFGQKYAIFPRHGVGTYNTEASAGISVGTNGINVAELSYDYMPVLLSWSGSISGWTHIAVVYQNKQPRLYVNGQLVKTGLTSLRTAVYPSYSFNGGAYGTMKGFIDEVRIWNSALSQSHIAANMNTAVLPNSSGLSGYWPMSPCDGSTIQDITGNGHHSVLITSNWQWVSNGAPVTGQETIEYASHFIVPDHGLATTYAYNSLNQVINQRSPDGGSSEFFYDRLGRLTISQNEEQKTPKIVDAQNPANRYSYTRYDALGRITEVGEKLNASSNPTETDTRNDSWMQGWLSSGNNRQVTVTAYDITPAWAPASLTGTLRNLRKRVVASALLSTASPNTDPSQNRTSASYYSYDLIGNVNTLVQENTDLKNVEQSFVNGSGGLKKIQYQYDLVSGKVNKVLYQDGKWDQFYYQYIYDADNRVVKALSSRNNYSDANLWVTEATYRYYLHGPLARMELGNYKVQGVDYAYTLQGWLKGVNSQSLDPLKDMSGDGKLGDNNYFLNSARDVYGFSLGYYNKNIAAGLMGDYAPIATGANAFELQYQPPSYDPSGEPRNFETGKNLFNGNISHATYAIKQLENGSTVGYTYRYDQLNRITGMRRNNIGAGVTTWNNTSIIDAYKEEISYDANGNIKTYQRNGNLPLPDNSYGMDNMTYNYNVDNNGRLVNNKLRHVDDDPALTNFYTKDINDQTEDIDDQEEDNYTYDNIGNLVKDNAEKITKIDWTVYGKIKGIFKDNRTGNPELGIPYTGTTTSIGYTYDASGNRITKSVATGNYFPGLPPSFIISYTYYVRDAQGNVMAVYNSSPGGMMQGSFTWSEQHLYGSNRLGIATPALNIMSEQSLASDAYTSIDDPITNGTLGKRFYELSNHLGNVLVTITDTKTGVDAEPNGTTDYYVANVLSANDYYPFGMLQPGRKFNAGGYRYGFNGKENDNEIKGEGNQQDYGMRIYDPRLGKFLSIDPLSSYFPWYTPYQFAGNTPIQAIDLDGGEPEFMVDKNGRLTNPMITLLNAAFNYSITKMKHTKWHHTKTDFFANTILNRIGYNPEINNYYENSDPEEWINFWYNLVVHEHKHRNEYKLVFWPVWGLNYFLETLGWDTPEHDKGFYSKNAPSEKRAYAKEPEMIELMNFQDGLALKVLEASKDETSDELKVKALQIIGYWFNVDKLNKKIATLEKQKEDLTGNAAKKIERKINRTENMKGKLEKKIAILADEEVAELFDKMKSKEKREIKMPDENKLKKMKDAAEKKES